jgi:hypothetical protein
LELKAGEATSFSVFWRAAALLPDSSPGTPNAFDSRTTFLRCQIPPVVAVVGRPPVTFRQEERGQSLPAWNDPHPLAILAEELKRREWKESELANRRKSVKEKCIAGTPADGHARLCQSTALPPENGKTMNRYQSEEPARLQVLIRLTV